MQVFNVQGMTCAHCVRAITQAIAALDPAAQVTVDLAAGQVSIASELASSQLVAAIQAEGYSVGQPE